MSAFRQYRRKQIAELRPFVEGEVLPQTVSVSVADQEAGSLPELEKAKDRLYIAIVRALLIEE